MNDFIEISVIPFIIPMNFYGLAVVSLSLSLPFSVQLIWDGKIHPFHLIRNQIVISIKCIRTAKKTSSANNQQIDDSIAFFVVIVVVIVEFLLVDYISVFHTECHIYQTMINSLICNYYHPY